MSEFRRQSSEIMEEFQAQGRLEDDLERRRAVKAPRPHHTDERGRDGAPGGRCTSGRRASGRRSARDAGGRASGTTSVRSDLSPAPDTHHMGAEADVRMPLTAHLEELRTRIIRSLLGIAAGFLLSYGFAERLVSWLLRPLTAIRPEQSLVIGTGVTDAFFTKLKVAGVAGVFVASPIVFYQAWKFVAPGLYERERRIAVPFSAAATFFFVSGAAFCYYLVFPVAFTFFLDEFTSVGISPRSA